MSKVFSQTFLSMAVGTLSLLLLAGVVGPSWAFEIKPGAQVVRGNAGSTIQATFEIVNDKEEPLKATIAIRDSHTIPENKEFSVTQWLTPGTTTLLVPSMGSLKVPFTIKVPAKAVGELAALVSFTPIVPEAPKPKTVEPGSILTRIVTLVTVSLYVQVKGTERSQADIDTVKVVNIPGHGDIPSSVQASVLINNTGNIQQRPGGRFEIRKKGERVVKMTPEFTEGAVPVFGESERLFTAHQPGTLDAGDYEVTTTVTFGHGVSTSKKTAFTVDAAGATGSFKEN